MKSIKSLGPRTGPGGTPLVTRAICDSIFSILICWNLATVQTARRIPFCRVRRTSGSARCWRRVELNQFEHSRHTPHHARLAGPTEANWSRLRSTGSPLKANSRRLVAPPPPPTDPRPTRTSRCQPPTIIDPRPCPTDFDRLPTITPTQVWD